MAAVKMARILISMRSERLRRPTTVGSFVVGPQMLREGRPRGRTKEASPESRFEKPNGGRNQA